MVSKIVHNLFYFPFFFIQTTIQTLAKYGFSEKALFIPRIISCPETLCAGEYRLSFRLFYRISCVAAWLLICFLLAFSLSSASLLFISSIPLEAPFLFLGLKENAVLFLFFSLAYSLSYHAIQCFYPDKRPLKAIRRHSYDSNASYSSIGENGVKGSLYARFQNMFLSKNEKDLDNFRGSQFFDNEYKLEQPVPKGRENDINDPVHDTSLVL